MRAAKWHGQTHDQFCGLPPAETPNHGPAPAARTATLTIRVTPGERDVLTRAARAARLDTGPYVRRSALMAAGVQAR